MASPRPPLPIVTALIALAYEPTFQLSASEVAVLREAAGLIEALTEALSLAMGSFENAATFEPDEARQAMWRLRADQMRAALARARQEMAP